MTPPVHTRRSSHLTQTADERTINGGKGNITLERAPQTADAVCVPAGGVIRARYPLHVPPDKTAGEAVLAVPGWSAQRVAFVVGGSVSAPPPDLVDGGAGPTTPPRDTDVPQTQLENGRAHV